MEENKILYLGEGAGKALVDLVKGAEKKAAQELATATQAIDADINAVEEKISDYDTVKADVNLIKSDYLKGSDKTDLDTAIKAVAKDLSDHETAFETYKGTVDSTYAKNADLNTAKSDLQSQITANKEAIDALGSTDGGGSLGDLATQVATNKQNIDALQKAGYQTAADVQGTVDAAVAEAKEAILGEDLKDALETLEAVKSWKDEHGTEYTDLLGDVQDNTAAIAAEKSRAEGVEAGLRTDVDKANTAIADMSGSVGGSGQVVTAVSQSNGKITGSSIELNATNVKATAVGDGSAETVQGVLGELNTAIAGVKATANSNSAAITSLQEDVADLKGVTYTEITAAQIQAWYSAAN